jgi:hypothetical protein
MNQPKSIKNWQAYSYKSDTIQYKYRIFKLQLLQITEVWKLLQM